MTLEERLTRIESLLIAISSRQSVREWYSVEEFARIVGRSVLTCRCWCRMGRIQASKKESGRGAHRSWAISHEEVQRYQKEGLLRGQ